MKFLRGVDKDTWNAEHD